MNLADAYSLWDWPTAGGLLVVGLITGLLLLPMAWPTRRLTRARYPVALASFLMAAVGVVFFVFLLVFRQLDGVPNAIRLITTATQWLMFCAALDAGLRIRDRIEAARP